MLRDARKPQITMRGGENAHALYRVVCADEALTKARDQFYRIDAEQAHLGSRRVDLL